MNILIFVLAGIGVALIFGLLRRVSSAKVLRESVRKGSRKVLPLLELVIWVVYAFWGVHVFFRDHIFFDAIVVAMVVILLVSLAWFVLRDFLAGVLIRAEKPFEPGQVMRTSEASGKIMKLGSLSVELLNDDGEVVRIPYARLNRDLIALPPGKEDNLPQHAEVALLPGQNPGEMQKMITNAMLSMPWIVSPPPEVQVVKTPDGQTVLHVIYHTHMRSHARLVEEKLAGVIAGDLTAPGPR